MVNRLSHLLPLIFVDLLLIEIVYGQQYIPGQPGASWTRQEFIATRGHLRWITRNSQKALLKVGGGPIESLEGKIDNWQNVTGQDIFSRYSRMVDAKPPGIRENGRTQEALLPNIGKMIRLNFHDCIKDSETGGCNGCLNFDHMGEEHHGVKSQGCHEDQTCARDSLPKFTDNNNLLWVARVLEILYTNKSPPFSSNSNFRLEKSLKDSGKSRADLWALAGLVALEISSQNHNNFCNGKGGGLCPGQVDERSPPCGHVLPTLKFKTGRKDCIPNCSGSNSYYGFCSTAVEIHPNPHGNGLTVTKFFKDTFNFDSRESVALLGAHTLGHANDQMSGFRNYPWTHGGFEQVLNNNYYKQMSEPGMYRVLKRRLVGKMQYCKLNVSTFIGDEYGNPIATSWLVRSQFQHNDGGAWNWNPFGRRCDPRICSTLSNPEMSKASCCRHFGPDGLDCINTNKGKCKTSFCNPNTDNQNCSSWRFMQTSYLNVDMGLYRKFETDNSSGRPTGCTGFNNPMWLQNRKRESDVPHGCPLNDARDENRMAMHEIVELFANNQQLWIDEFLTVFEKMQENGYGSESLTCAWKYDAKNQWPIPC